MMKINEIWFKIVSFFSPIFSKVYSFIPEKYRGVFKDIFAVIGIISTIYFIIFFSISKPKMVEKSEKKVEVLENVIKVNNKEIKQLHKEKKEVNIQIRQKFQKSLLEYQLQLQKCIFPFCLNDIKTNNLCKDHLKYKTDECVICFEKFDENYYPLKCGHWIHNKCLELTGNNKCSLCKKENIYFI